MRQRVLIFAIFAILLAAPRSRSQTDDSGDELNSIEAQASRLFEQVKDDVVRIHAYADAGKNPDLSAHRVGTGFIIDKKGWIATTAGNVAGAEKILIEWRGRT